MEITVNCPDCGKKLNITVMAEESPQTEIIRRTSRPTTWGEISEKIKAGKAREILSVGDIIPFTMKDGQTVNAVVAEIDSYDENEVAFVTEDCLADVHAMNKTDTNAGGWRDCEMRKYLNSTVFKLLPDDLKSVISERSIIQYKYGEEIVSCDRLWLLSSTEVGFPHSEEKDDEYFSLFSDERSKIKQRERTTRWYWLRTPCMYSSECFRGITATANTLNRPAGDLGGVVFGFLIK